MSIESYSTPFDSETYGGSCHDLFEEESLWQEYDGGPDNFQKWVWRSQEYIDYPNRYDIAEYAIDLGYKDNPYLVHAMYVVTAMAMEDDEDGFRRVNQWFISYDMASQQEEVNYLFRMLNPNLTEDGIQQKGNDNFKFAIDSGLARPNQIDMLELGWAIEMLKQAKQNNQQ